MNAAVVVGAAVAAVLVSALIWRAAAEVYASPVLTRRNYRDHELPVAAGAVIVLAVLAVAAVAEIVAALDDGSDPLTSLHQAVVLAVGFGLLGLIDDLVGDVARKGFRGHLGAALRGELTTGGVKLAGGVAVGVVVVGMAFPVGDVIDLGRGALLVAASANLGNLFDRAPGRVVKMSVIGIAVAVACGAPASALAGPVVVVAAGVGMLVPDLRERCMLGDTGSNVLGAAVGVGLVAALGGAGEWVALAVVVVGNLVSERISFSRVIDAVAPLRWCDRLGSLRR